MELLEIENLQALMFGPPLYAVYAQILAASQLRKCDNIDSGDVALHACYVSWF